MGTAKQVQVKHLLRQGCISAIIKRIETLAETGFSCLLPCDEGLKIRNCRPFLCCMQLDSKETCAYACLRAERCCPWCRLRNGRSAFRRSRPHDPAEITVLWNTADGPPGQERTKARARLKRHGWHPTRRCELLSTASKCLLPGPEGGGPFRGIIGVDIMHGVFIAWSRYLLDALRKILPTAGSKPRRALESFASTFVLRDSVSGKRLRRIHSLLGKEGLTAEKRVIIVFLLATALGTDGTVLSIPPEVYQALVQCIVSAEVVFLSCRGHRPYTEVELSTIWESQTLLFFSGLARIAKYTDEEVRVAEIGSTTLCMF